MLLKSLHLQPAVDEPDTMAQDDMPATPPELPDTPFGTRGDDAVFTSVDLDVPIEAVGSAPTGTTTLETRLPYAALTVHPLEGDSRVVEMDQPRFILGRGSADLLLDDRFVSRWHAQIYIDERESVILEDMGSENGVFLRIADELALEDGDEIVVGDQHFVFRDDWEEAGAPDKASEAPKPPGEDPPAMGAPVAGSPVRLLRYFEGGVLADIHPIGDRLTIGSDGTDIECPEDFELSPSHAEILRDGERFFLRDLQSEFGTFIRIQDSVELVDGDCFVIGRTRIDVECP